MTSLLKVYFSQIKSITLSGLLAKVVTEDQMSIVVKNFRKALSTTGEFQQEAEEPEAAVLQQ